MDLCQYDIDELAGQIQHGLERVAVSFLRAHGARIHRDQADFHGKEYVELELSHGDHRLTIRQTRAAPPSEFENRLGDALERVFAQGIESLPEVVARLNADGSRDAEGRPWSEASFQETLRRLGA